MRLIPAQIVLIPLGLILSVIMIIVFANSTNVDETSPMLASRDAVQRWAGREEQAQHCLARSIDLDIAQENLLVVGGPSARWFGLLRCNQPIIYLRWAILLIAPWLVLNLLFLTLVGWNRPIPRGI